jgi:wobble nucleotide-excising tRNase
MTVEDAYNDGLVSLDNIEYPGVFSGPVMTGERLEEYNVVYGWNASGKSTLCRILRSIGLKNVNADASFKITHAEANKLHELSEVNIALHKLKLKVFCQEFINECIQYENSGRVKSIIRLGPEGIGLKDRVTKYRRYKKSVEDNINQLGLTLKQSNKALERHLQTIAQITRSTCSLSQAYNKNAVETAYKQNFTNTWQDLGEALAEKQKVAQSSENKNSINLIDLEFDHINDIYTKLLSLYRRAVVPTQVIELFTNSPALEKWVHEGITFHEDKDKCLFCDNSLTEQRKKSLLAHFSKEFEELEISFNNFENILNSCLQKIEVIAFQDASEFYEDEQEKWKSFKPEFFLLINNYKKIIGGFLRAITHKRNNLYNQLDEYDISAFDVSKEQLDVFLAEVFKFNGNRKNFILAHNSRTKNFQKEKEKAVEEIKGHFLQINFEEYNSLSKDSMRIEHRISKTKNLLDKLDTAIAAINEKISETHLGAIDINKKLYEFLGHDNIALKELTDSDGTKCYQLQRRGRIASNLCEGEKNAIALIYFIESLNNDTDSLEESIVVLDDPISSYDSANMYNAIAFMKVYLGKARQIIIFTHNYAVFSELRKWFSFAKKDKRKSKIFQIVREKHISKLVKANSTLEKFHTEYEFLFAELFNANLTKETDYASKYYLLNAARRVLEVFLTFKQGSSNELNENTRTLLRNAEKSGKIGQVEWRVVNDLINQGSHANIDIAGTASFSLAEHINDAVNGTLSLINSIDPFHYNAMANLASKGVSFIKKQAA